MLGAVGRVLPATKGPVVLKAQTASGEVMGQVRVSKGGEIATVSLVPPDAAPPPDVLRAIAEADQIVLGPGSLFTSVLAACVVPGIREGLRSSPAARGLRREPARAAAPRPPGSTSRGCLGSLRAHGVDVDVVLADKAALALGEFPDDTALVTADVAGPGFREHDPQLLGAELAWLVNGDVLRCPRQMRKNVLVPKGRARSPLA